MKPLFLSKIVSSLSVKSLVLLFSLVLGSSAAYAGGMPSDVEEKTVLEQSVEASEPVPETTERMPVTEDSSEPASGFTIGIRGAFSILNSSDVSASDVNFMGSQYGPLEVTDNSGMGFNASLSLGYAFASGLRIEGEGGYLENCFTEMNVKTPGTLELLGPAPSGETKISGHFSALTLMLNAFYDVKIGGGVVPYLGGGLGVARLSVDKSLRGAPSPGRSLIDDDDYVFAYQVGAGLSYKVGALGGGLPEVTVSLDYRYMSAFDDPKFKEALTGNYVESEFGGHYIGGGIRLGLF